MVRLLRSLGKYFIVSIPLFLFGGYAHSKRWNDSLGLDIGSKITVATKDFQPFWDKAQQFGVISNDQVDASSYLRISNKNILIPHVESRKHSHELSISYGLSLYNNNHFKDGLVEQAYAQAKYGAFCIIGGRYEDKFDDVNNNLSSGSFGISRNALPIPKISIAIFEYTNLPLTNGWFQVKGILSHGWFGSDRFLESYLHEKQFYVRVGKGKLKLYGGLQHFAEWGGRRPQDNIHLERSFKGFLDVLFVKEANDGSLDTNIYKGYRPNRAGDQRGLMEYGFYLDNDNWEMHTYFQVPFESGTGIDIRNIDRLAGVYVKSKKDNSRIQSLLFEFLYTKQMEGFVSGEKQSYYNNGTYKTGWEYEGRVIGNPFLTNRVEASNYFPVEPFDWKNGKNIPANNNIINSRVISLHLGGCIRLSNLFSSRTLLSSTMNYGARNYGELYGDGKFQFYGLEEITYHNINSKLKYKLGLAFDAGQLYNNIGGSLAINYRIF